MALQPGLEASADLVVSDADTAASLGSGDVPALGTPRLIALCEEATFKATERELPAGCTTVAVRVQIDHLAPAGPGTQVHAHAVLERVEGRRLTFKVSVTDEAGVLGAGKVTRVIVEREKFLKRLA